MGRGGRSSTGEMASFGGSAARSPNIQCFLNRTTPIVPSQLLPKACLKDLNRLWHPSDSEAVKYFTLQDLWGCYDEWSACGAGVPVALKDERTLIQYYVSYLSAIQIYTSPPFFSNPRHLNEDTETSDVDTRDFSDSRSHDSESDKLWRSDVGSSEDCNLDQDGAWNFNDRLGQLHFQYFETSNPCGRVPLMDKINELADGFPGLMTLKSVDLSPASWMAVAWYPIYQVPKSRVVKGLSTCFLTYHTLSSAFQDSWLKQLGVQHHDFSYFTGIRRGRP